MTNEEKKAKWIEALESGKFEQVKECLVSNGKYCCIGIYGVEVMGINKDRLDVNKEHGLSELDIGGSMSDLMPDVARVYIEFKDLFGETLKNFAVRLNDNGKTFAEIAAEAKNWPVSLDQVRSQA